MVYEVIDLYIIPALRREVALTLKKLNIKQEQIAKLLMVSKSAVSQYLNNKRRGAKLPLNVKTSINIAIKRLVKTNKLTTLNIYSTIQQHLQQLINNGFVCDCHLEFSNVSEAYCKICLLNNI